MWICVMFLSSLFLRWGKISFFLYFYYFNVITIAQKMIEILFPQLWLGLEIFPQIKEKLASFSEGLSAKEIFIELLFLIKFPWITSFSNWIGKIFLFSLIITFYIISKKHTCDLYSRQMFAQLYSMITKCSMLFIHVKIPGKYLIFFGTTLLNPFTIFWKFIFAIITKEVQFHFSYFTCLLTYIQIHYTYWRCNIKVKIVSWHLGHGSGEKPNLVPAN